MTSVSDWRKRRSLARKARRLTYGMAWCECGAQMAYDPRADAKAFDCSDILLERAASIGQLGSVTHSDTMPFIFWKVKQDRSGKAPIRKPEGVPSRSELGGGVL